MRFEALQVRLTDWERGIWDNLDGTWVATGLDPVDAVKHAAELSIFYTERGPRPAADVRRLDPPRRVEIRIIARRTEEGLLYAWVREPSGWYGLEFRTERGEPKAWHWSPAERLKPID